MAASAAPSSGNPAAIQASSAAAERAQPGPGAMPRPMKSADLSGKTGALQREGKVASECQADPPPRTSASRPAARDRCSVQARGDRARPALPARPNGWKCATSRRPSTRSAHIPHWRDASVRAGARRLRPPTQRAPRGGASHPARAPARPRASHVGVTGEQRHAAENPIEQSRFRHRGKHRHRMLGKQELEELARTRSRDNCSRPARPAMQAASPAGSSAPSP